MRQGLLWTIICIICIAILLSIGSLFKYSGNKIKLDIPMKASMDYAHPLESKG